MTPLLYLKDYEKVYEGEYCLLYDMRQDVPHTGFALWKGFYRLDNPHFEKDMRITLNFIKEQCIRVLISDHSQLKMITDDVLAWFHAQWYPTAEKYGLRHENVLAPESIFAKITLNKMLEVEKLGGVKPLFVASFTDARQEAVQIARKLWNFYEDTTIIAQPFETEQSKLLHIHNLFNAMEQPNSLVTPTITNGNISTDNQVIREIADIIQDTNITPIHLENTQEVIVPLEPILPPTPPEENRAA